MKNVQSSRSLSAMEMKSVTGALAMTAAQKADWQKTVNKLSYIMSKYV